MTDLRKYRLCAGCGKPIYGNGYSTVIPKYCPNCKYKKAYKENKESKKAKIKAKRKPTARQQAMNDADTWFSRYIRLNNAFYASGVWFCKCYTCNKPISISKIQNGHWQRRGYKTVRFDLNNARPQCLKCNYYESGKPEIFELKLIKEVGQDEVDRIKLLAQETGEDNEIFYREQAEKYEKLAMDIVNQKEIPIWWKEKKKKVQKTKQ